MRQFAYDHPMITGFCYVCTAALLLSSGVFLWALLFTTNTDQTEEE